MTVRLPVIQGTLREGNETAVVADYTLERFRAHEEITSTLVNPGELGLGDLEMRLPKKDMLGETERSFVETVEAADGFAIVTPEYNHGYPGALKNVIDHIWEPWAHKAFGLVTVGGSVGGVRCEEQLRLVVNGGLNSQTVPRAVNVPHPADMFTDEGPADPDTWESRFDQLAEQLTVYARAMREVRDELTE
ncbi:hypothetical protein BRD56_10330 [Thermoplasmatales archaeon SW_10_69_26]|nr:MAG: hypothetical protein BRD56_10330 [Thermoplasmatales archaeon SW_10_69_26]